MATYPTNPPGFTLQAIQQKVRRLTRSPSEAQLTTDDLNNYINTFVVYDFPEHLRTFNYRTTFSFYVNAYQDEYPTNIDGYGGASGAMNNQLYNFQNLYLSLEGPVYSAGYQITYYEDRQQFFGNWPKIDSIALTGFVGDGVTQTWSGYINSQQSYLPPNVNQQITLLMNDVLFTSVDTNFNTLQLIDVPYLDSVTGNPTIWGGLYVPGTEPVAPNLPLLTAPYGTYAQAAANATFDTDNFINYLTGQYTITFNTAPQVGYQITSQTVPQVTSRPLSLLFYDEKFVVRPVPDQSYQIQFEAYVRPTQLLQTNSAPGLEEYWQYIAYGAAKKIFEDRMDIDSVQLILPEYRKQENLVLRRTLVQYTNQRAQTIYTESLQAGNGFGGNGGNFGNSGVF